MVSHCIASDDGSGASSIATPQLPPLRVVGDAADTVGAEVCKTGPPIPYSKTLKNVLVVGDSVSIGYTPFVAKVMASTAFVQHSPWGGDGGAEETKYGAACIGNLVRAPDGTALSPDVLMFNWGLHNSLAGNCTAPCVPGQSGPPAEYAPYLEKIVASLLATPALKTTKLLFAITSPDLCNAPIDHIQAELNAQAAAIMKKNNIPTVRVAYSGIIYSTDGTSRHLLVVLKLGRLRRWICTRRSPQNAGRCRRLSASAVRVASALIARPMAAKGTAGLQTAPLFQLSRSCFNYRPGAFSANDLANATVAVHWICSRLFLPTAPLHSAPFSSTRSNAMHRLHRI